MKRAAGGLQLVRRRVVFESCNGIKASWLQASFDSKTTPLLDNRIPQSETGGRPPTASFI
ncbi:unnamed protein product, partial [Nesidiocoris tenuis]